MFDPRIVTLALTIGSLYTSCGVCRTPPGPAFTSSVVPGTRSGPGSATIPLITVPVTPVVLTVVKVEVWLEPPAAPVPAASRNAPSAAARIDRPTMCIVIADEPGSWVGNNKYAYEPSCAGAIVAATGLPAASAAKKVDDVSVNGLTAREKLIRGRYVTPTSTWPSVGV